MEDNLKSKIGFIFFFIVIVGLAIGGYFFTNYIINKKPERTNEDIVSYKIDKSKDYIYFENESVISEDAEIDYKDVVINIIGQENLTEALRKENEIHKNNIEYISKQSILSNELIQYNHDDLYSLTFRTYKTYEFGHYTSLLIQDYHYSCFDLVTFSRSKAYVFDTNKGLLLSYNDLLNKYNLTTEGIKDKVKEYLIKKQSKINGVDVILIDDTLNNITEDNLFINEYGKLSISYLVKTVETEYNYNEITEV